MSSGDRDGPDPEEDFSLSTTTRTCARRLSEQLVMTEDFDVFEAGTAR